MNHLPTARLYDVSMRPNRSSQPSSVPRKAVEPPAIPTNQLPLPRIGRITPSRWVGCTGWSSSAASVKDVYRTVSACAGRTLARACNEQSAAKIKMMRFVIIQSFYLLYFHSLREMMPFIAWAFCRWPGASCGWPSSCSGVPMRGCPRLRRAPT